MGTAASHGIVMSTHSIEVAVALGRKVRRGPWDVDDFGVSKHRTPVQGRTLRIKGMAASPRPLGRGKVGGGRRGDLPIVRLSIPSNNF